MTYRSLINTSDLEKFELLVKETNLLVLFRQNSVGDNELKNIAYNSLLNFRQQVEDYIQHDPSFQGSYVPLKVGENAPALIKEMANTSALVNVGPMAAVAGAIAEFVGRKLLGFCKEIIVENGGDIFLKTEKKRRVGLYAGESPFSKKIALEIIPETTPLGICSSSGMFGHSSSFGKANLALAVAKSVALADASATAIGNLIQTKKDLSAGIKFARGIPGLTGTVIIKEDRIAIWGKIKITNL